MTSNGDLFFKSIRKMTDSKQTINNHPDYQDHHKIKTNNGLQNFIRTIYIFSGLAACYAITLAQFIFPIAIQHVYLFIFGGCIGSMIFGELLKRQKSKIYKTNQGYTMKHTPTKLLTFLVAITSFACMISPFVGFVYMKDPSILPMATFFTFMLSGSSVMVSRILSEK